MTVYETITITRPFSGLLLLPTYDISNYTVSVLLSSLQFSLLFFLPLSSVGSSLPTERSSCILVLLRRLNDIEIETG